MFPGLLQPVREVGEAFEAQRLLSGTVDNCWAALRLGTWVQRVAASAGGGAWGWIRQLGPVPGLPAEWAGRIGGQLQKLNGLLQTSKSRS